MPESRALIYNIFFSSLVRSLPAHFRVYSSRENEMEEVERKLNDQIRTMRKTNDAIMIFN